MKPSRALAALALLLALLAPVARAQVSAPRMLGDEPAAEPDNDGEPADEADDEPVVPRLPRVPLVPPAPGGADGAGVVAPPPRPAPAADAPGAGAPDGEGAGAPPAQAWMVYDQPPPPPPTEPSSDLARRIVPVTATWDGLMAAWGQRREALREQDPARAQAAEATILAGKEELAIENLVAFAAALGRESQRSLDANLPAEAVEQAELAVRLAPDFADAHAALARARLARSARDAGAILAALGGTFAAAAREPHTVRAFAADLAGAALAAIFAAAAATAAVTFVRRLRLFLHDFHHLPLLRGTAPIQSTFLALVLFASPAAFGLGPVAMVAVAVAVIWLYLSNADRIMASATILALVATPWLAGAGVRAAAWTGTLAEVVHELEHGAFGDADAAVLASRWEQRAAPPALAAALGRHFKRRGDLEAARKWYGLALAADEGAAEVRVNLGNVLFLQGDLEGAKAAYLLAADRAAGDLTTLAAAHYDLSKLYLRTSELEKSQAARERAQQEDGPFLARYGSDEDFSANRYLVDVPVPERKVVALAAAGSSSREIEGYVRARLLGSLPPVAWPWAGIGFVVILWGVALARGRLAPSTRCERCGHPACRRCEPAAGPLCGQCVNAFVKKGVVDARDRLRKEAQIRRHEQINLVGARILAVTGGGAGLVWHGAVVAGFLYLLGIFFFGAILWFWRGVLPPPYPSPWVLLGKLVVALPAGLVLYGLALRAAFRRVGS